MAWKRFVYASDIHGDKQDAKANKVLFSFLKTWKPEIRVCGGDLWDFRPLRRGADADERRESMRTDFEAGKQWLEKFQATHFLRGNHDERLWDLAERGDGVLSDYAVSGLGEVAGLMKSLKCRMLPYDRRFGVLRIGKLKMIHGFAFGVNAARRQAQTYGSVLMGHAHGIQHVSIEGLENRVGRMCGCLCDLDMEFERARIASLVHRHGFAYGVVHETTGLYHVWQAEDINGTWVLPSDICVINSR